MKKTYMDNGFYRITGKQAWKLLRKYPGPRGAKLRDGYERAVIDDEGKSWWLCRTPWWGKFNWALHEAAAPHKLHTREGTL